MSTFVTSNTHIPMDRTSSTPEKKRPRELRTYSLDPVVIRAVEQLAEEENRSVSNMVETILRGVTSDKKKMNML